jgi:lysophospholipase L1-like esterase
LTCDRMSTSGGAGGGAGIPAEIQSLSSVGQPTAAASLRGWWVALGQRGTRRADIAVIGDSITCGNGASAHSNRWVERLAAQLRQRLALPTGGRGYISAQNSGVTTYTWPAALSGGAAVAGNQWGPNKSIVALSAAGQTITYQLAGTSCDVMYLRGTGLGTFSYSVDGGAVTNIVTTNASNVDGTVTRVVLGAAGAHTLTLTWVAGTNFVEGVIEYNGDETSGLIVHDCGHGGTTTNDWAVQTGGSTPTYGYPNALATLSPDLVIALLGANDVSTSVPLATYQSNWPLIMSLVKAKLATPLPPVLYVSLAAPAGLTTAWQPYMNSLYGVSSAQGQAAVADLRLRVPNVDDVPNWGIYFDSVHPNDAGHALIADALERVLLPS